MVGYIHTIIISNDDTCKFSSILNNKLDKVNYHIAFDITSTNNLTRKNI